MSKVALRAFMPLALIVLLVLSLATNARAQSSEAVYWRYDAPGRLSLVVVDDRDHDGIDEFVVVADDRLVIALDSDGRAAWNIPFEAENDVVFASTVDVDGLDSTPKEIVLATEARLVLLNNEGEELWRRPLRAGPAALAAQSQSQNGPQQVLIADENGTLLRFDGEGFLVREYELGSEPASDASPILAVDDVDQDGESEIVYSYFTDDGFSELVLMEWDGRRRWERSDSGRVTALTLVGFQPDGSLDIALATTLNRIYLYSADGTRRWPYRTPNRAVTSLEPADLNGQPALVVGTDVGSAIAYDTGGRRIWSRAFDPDARRPILSVMAAPHPVTDETLVDLAMLLGPADGDSGSLEIVLLDGEGRRLEPSYSAQGEGIISQLVDMNRDGRNELLLAGFATLELLDPGIGARQYFESWDYRLGAEPGAMAVADLDRDGTSEILVGNSDGSLHALASDGTLDWVANFDGVISHIAIAQEGSESPPRIIVAHNQIIAGDEGQGQSLGFVEILLSDGTTETSIPIDSTVTTLLVSDLNLNPPPEIVVGTADGKVIAYSLVGEEFWQTNLTASVDQLHLVESARGPDIVLATGANTILRLSNKGDSPVRLSGYLDEVSTLDLTVEDETFVPVMLVTLEDGTLRSLSIQGNQNWITNLDGVPTATFLAGNSMFVGTDEAELVRVDLGGEELMRRSDVGRITSIYYGDLDGDVRPDIAYGNREGEVHLLTGDGRNHWGQLDLASEVFAVTALRRPLDQQAELLVITENGVMQLFRSLANRPPLLINPETDVGQGEYTIAVTVLDVEFDPVAVALEIQNEETGRWTTVGEKVATSGRDTLVWPVTPPDDATEVAYRFTYDDGTHAGTVHPASGPPPISPRIPFANIALAIFIGLAGALAAAVYVRQARSPDLVARRFFRRQRLEPQATLMLLEEEYNKTGGSPDFLLSLANRARREGDTTLASLADGLFLLAARPDSGLPVINGALEDAQQVLPRWQLLDEWRLSYEVGQELLTAPSLTQLSLMQAPLEDLIRLRNEAHLYSEAFDGLLPVLSSIHDSERVDLAEDRIVYLNEALGLLRQLEYRVKDWPIQIENTLVRAISSRWLGIVWAEIEDLHGRAQIVVNLLTKNLVPNPRTIVALSIRNVGRAPAEHVDVALQADPAYNIVTQSQRIPYLSPGRKRQLYFSLEPDAAEEFRVEFTISYADRHSEDKHFVFADMVHLLPAEREYKPVVNPYSPGMPLRSNSSVFFGRSQLFAFLKENAASFSQKNVLILIGQRRTGKTSALLQLGRQLADDLLPVYVDCQSLGVSPGLASLFNDLAWAISDALAERGIALEVPETSYWNRDAGSRFEREFLTLVRGLLPEETTILLVFDEFESFEDLVREGILPKTLFAYLRHLMQHAEGVSFIFSGTRRLEEMGTDYWSVLFNSALYRYVGFLDPDSARRLISDPVSPNLIYDDIAVDKILRVTAGHPYFLQLVCYTLVNRANQRRSSYITISDVNSAIDEMLRLGEVHFAYIWQRSSYAERALLAASSKLMDYASPFRPDDLVQELSQYGIHLQPAQVTDGLNRLVERGILREIGDEGAPLFELRIGLVGMWVAQNKSFGRLYASAKRRPVIGD